MVIGVVGSGAMGSGIAQVAAMSGIEVMLYDSNPDNLSKSLLTIQQSVQKFVDKGKMAPEDGVAISGRIYLCENLETFTSCSLIIEAIVEDLSIKKDLFSRLEKIVDQQCILATNTSSLSVTSIAASLNHPERCCGIHFFNPPVLMQLVELIPAVQTRPEMVIKVRKMLETWGKTVVIAKDTPGFIVNKVARPYYSESIKIMEEGLADIVTIDRVMTNQGFKMGPFALMDFIGHDVNYRVTESVWKSFYYDSRYRPAFSQLRLLEAGYLGKKSGRGFYDYTLQIPTVDNITEATSDLIFMRIISMLINEACDTVGQGICNAHDVEQAVKLGVNYPKGLLEWGQQIGFKKIADHLDELYMTYHEERYRVSPYLKNLAKV